MRLEEEMDKLRGEHSKLQKAHDNLQTEVIEPKIEQPIESQAISELSHEADLSLDGMACFSFELIVYIVVSMDSNAVIVYFVP